MKWREKWWEEHTLVDKLTPPLIARLEAEGWVGLSEDMATRKAIAERFAGTNGVEVLPQCKYCKGEGMVVVHIGPSPWDDDEFICPYCRGSGVDEWTDILAEDNDLYGMIFIERGKEEHGDDGLEDFPPDEPLPF